MLLKQRILRVLNQLLDPFDARLVRKSTERVAGGSDRAAKESDVAVAFQLLLGRLPNESEEQRHRKALRGQDYRLTDLASALMAMPEFRTAHARDLSPFDSTLTLREANGHNMLMPERDWVYDTREATVTYEPWVASAIRANLKPGGVFLDIGANIGIHAVAASHCVGPEGRVIAVEAFPANAAILMKTILACGYGNITVCAVPLSDQVGPEWLTHQTRGSNQNLRGDGDGASGGQRVAVMTMTGDRLLDGLARLDLVKIDVEGRERSVFTGMRQTLDRHRPAVIAEFHPQLGEADFVNLFLERRYTAQMIRLDGTLHRPAADLPALIDLVQRENAGTAWTHADILLKPLPS